MKTWIKLAGTGVLAAAAVWSAAAAISGISSPAQPADSYEGVALPAPESGAEFVLREYDGCVAVFAAGEKKPVTLTDIEVRGLRRADRELLSAGLPCAGREEVLALLEDLGS